MSSTPSPLTPPAPLRVEPRWLSERAVRIAVIGEIDLSTAEELFADLLGVILAGRPQHIEVDLAGVTFLDCRGLGVLVVARRVAARAGGRLRITGPQPLVRRVMEATGLLGILSSEPIGRMHLRGAARVSTRGRPRCATVSSSRRRP
ncbi:STAS domain-containing protein [Actinoplanes sp. NPDC049599]|uniref:STAS domain-containing protein n=1 Tax=Actinoplanes sp. NPDC049599 TaxID=3363903 RepID=UPI00379EE498